MSININDSKKGRELQGIVISDKMTKTIVVRVDRRVQHSEYKKIITKSVKFHAHDPNDECKIGDNVVIRECRPISKTKTWELVNILEKAG
jgi:small subunit ribosomal protein S17